MQTQSQSAPPPAPAPRGTNGLAIASLVLGLLSPLCCTFFTGIPAIITGILALSKINQTGQGGRGMAIAGLILGSFGLVVGIIYLAVNGLKIPEQVQQ